MELTSHLHPQPRLRMNGAVPVLLPYIFMACTYTAFLFFYMHQQQQQQAFWIFTQGTTSILVYCVSVVTVEWHRHKNIFIYTYRCNCVNKMSYSYNNFFCIISPWCTQDRDSWNQLASQEGLCSMEKVSITVVSENYCFLVTVGSFCYIKEVTLC